jgi:hypothetical protein
MTSHEPEIPFGYFDAVALVVGLVFWLLIVLRLVGFI